MQGFLFDCKNVLFDVLFPLVNCCWIMKYICRVELTLSSYIADDEDTL